MPDYKTLVGMIEGLKECNEYGEEIFSSNIKHSSWFYW